MTSRISVAALLLTLSLHPVATALPFRTVAITGQPAPGTPAGVVFSDFRDSVINENGIVVFGAGLTGTGVVNTHPSNNNGIWRESGGVLTKVVRAGDQAVGLPSGTNYYLPSPPRIDAAGRASFLAEAPGQSVKAVFSEGQGALRLVGRESEQISGQPAGVTFDSISLVPLMNDAGSIAFTSFIRGPGIPNLTEGLFTDRSGPLELVIKQGDPAPGISGATLRQIDTPAFNDNGVLAFTGRYTGGVFPNDYGLWIEQSGALTLVARSGDSPAGLPAGVVLGQFSSDIRINNAGSVILSSKLTGPGITSTNDTALWSYNGGSLQLVARKGAAAAGVPAGVNYGDFYREYINGPGKATFTGTLAGLDVTSQNDTGLWTERGGALALIAREGDSAPGTPAGVNFFDFSQLFGSLGLQVNSSGQVAFESLLTGAGVTGANDTGIWITDLAGTLRLVAREGDLFDVNDDPNVEDWRTIRTTDLQWYSGGGEDGYPSSFNSAGQLAIALTFTDFSAGVFVIDTAVPEPSTVLLLPMAIPFVRKRRRRDARRGG